MKKFLTIALALLMVLTTAACFASCNNNNTEDVIVVGYTLYPPMNYEENGELVGFDTDLAKAVFEGMGYKVIFKEIKWDNRYLELESGTIDCIWNGFTANTSDDDGVARADKVDFSYNYMLNQQAVVVLADKVGEYTDAATSFNEKFGSAEDGSAGEEFMTKSLTGAVCRTVTKQTDAILQVKTGGADFAVVDILLAKSIAGKGDYANLAIANIETNAEYYAIGFKKGSELTAKVNAELEKLAADGTMARLAEKYGVQNSVITDFADQK